MNHVPNSASATKTTCTMTLRVAKSEIATAIHIAVMAVTFERVDIGASPSITFT